MTKLDALMKKRKMLEGKGVTRVTTVAVGDQKPTVETEIVQTVATGKEDEELGEVGISYGLTIGLARKFEFARVDVSVRVPCTVSNRLTAFEEARKWAQEKIGEEVSSIRSAEKKRVEAEEPEL